MIDVTCTRNVGTDVLIVIGFRLLKRKRKSMEKISPSQRLVWVDQTNVLRTLLEDTLADDNVGF